MGKLDNTLVIYINGDNGTSAEGGPLGTPNEVAWFNGVNEMPVADQMKWYDVWGTEQTYNHMSAGWSWALDTPFTWFKQNASKLGGIRQNMAISWPAGIKDYGALREQFRHVIDIVPTILEVSGIAPPRLWTGSSKARSRARAWPTRSTLKTRRAYTAQDAVFRDDGPVGALSRKAGCEHQGESRAVEAFGAANPDPLNNQVLELYNLTTDFSQSQNIADKVPDKVKEMKQMFIDEASKY